MRKGLGFLIGVFMYEVAEGVGGIVADIVWREYKLRRPAPKPPRPKRRGTKRRRRPTAT